MPHDDYFACEFFLEKSAKSFEHEIHRTIQHRNNKRHEYASLTIEVTNYEPENGDKVPEQFIFVTRLKSVNHWEKEQQSGLDQLTGNNKKEIPIPAKGYFDAKSYKHMDYEDVLDVIVKRGLSDLDNFESVCLMARLTAEDEEAERIEAELAVGDNLRKNQIEVVQSIIVELFPLNDWGKIVLEDLLKTLSHDHKVVADYLSEERMKKSNFKLPRRTKKETFREIDPSRNSIEQVLEVFPNKWEILRRYAQIVEASRGKPVTAKDIIPPLKSRDRKKIERDIRVLKQAGAIPEK